MTKDAFIGITLFKMGGTDKIVRVLLAIAVGLLAYFNVVEGTLGYIVMAVAAIFVLTSFVGFCPLYGIFRLSTCKSKQ